MVRMPLATLSPQYRVLLRAVYYDPPTDVTSFIHMLFRGATVAEVRQRCTWYFRSQTAQVYPPKTVFMLTYVHAQASQAMLAVSRWAADPQLELTWHESELLTDRIKRDRTIN